ncbi:MAG: ribonuclease III, partial [Myxococcota bacterium]
MTLALDHVFADPSVLEVALTHASYAHEVARHVARRSGAPNAGWGPHNERLEFLGDAVLQTSVTAWLTQRFPIAREGELSRLRQRLVSTPALAAVARDTGLGAEIRLGVGEESTGGRDRPRILAGAVEAVIGAVFADGGYGPADALVRRWLSGGFAAVERETGWKDPRSLLQEHTQRESGDTPVYVVTDTSGPPHAPSFDVEVRIGPQVLGRGRGTSKREASRLAAEDALALATDPAPAAASAAAHP